MAAIYRDLAEDNPRTSQVTEDVVRGPGPGAALPGAHPVDRSPGAAHRSLQDAGHNPVVLRGGMGAKALDRRPCPAPARARASHHCWRWPPGPTSGKASTAPPWTPCSSPPRSRSQGRLVQYAGRILRPYPGKATGRNPRLPRHRHRRSRRIAGQTRRRIHQPRIPRPPAASPHTQFRAQPGNH